MLRNERQNKIYPGQNQMIFQGADGNPDLFDLIYKSNKAPAEYGY